VTAIVSIGPNMGAAPAGRYRLHLQSPYRLTKCESGESAIGLREQPLLLKRIERWAIERAMAIGLYVTPDGKIMVAYGARQIPLSCAQYKANGYKPSFEKLLIRSPRATVPSVSVLPSTRLAPEAGRRV
jgi:hypothetical protein